MKICSKCQTPSADDAIFCTGCGVRFDSASKPTPDTDTTSASPSTAQAAYTFKDPYNHTSEFEAEDISHNKIFAILTYLMGTAGIIIALLGAKDSPYAMFHIRQALKITIINILLPIIALLTCWTFIGPVVCGILALILIIIKVICFFWVCSGNAIEPYIIRSFKFFK